MRQILGIAVAAIVMAVGQIPVQVRAVDNLLGEENENGIVISRFQASGPVSGTSKEEFVEIYNNSDEDIDITEWCLLYNASTTAPLLCFISEKETRYFITAHSSVFIMTPELELKLQLADPAFSAEILFSATTNLATTNGSLSIVNPEGIIIDVLGWGSGVAEGTAVTGNIPAGKILQRNAVSEESETLQLQDTNNNSADFNLKIFDGLFSSNGLYELEVHIPETRKLLPNCEGVELTEILPNPYGADAGKEFIELFNPTDEDIVLDGCMLELGANKKKYVFNEDTLPAKSYRAYFDSLTGLVLPNASGGTVALIQGDTELQVITYPPAMGDDLSWVLFTGVWQSTSVLTPGSENLLPSPDIVIVDDEEKTVACPPGKIRNPETNRCKNIQTIASMLLPCSPGQIRNPETNRCRNTATLVSSLVSCKTGQERNPATNRCRNVLGASTAQAACKEGYERNRETNRCRKSVVAASSSPSVGSLPDGSDNKLDYTFIAAASLAVAGYGAYEYRRDFANAILRFKSWQALRKATK